jgi:hypothetical protein
MIETMNKLKTNGYGAGTYQDDTHEEDQIYEKRARLSKSRSLALQRATVCEHLSSELRQLYLVGNTEIIPKYGSIRMPIFEPAMKNEVTALHISGILGGICKIDSRMNTK